VDADISTYRAFGEALAIGMLVGIERYKSRAEGERKSAGVRTFTVIALLGATTSLLVNPLLTAVSFGGLLFFLGLGYWRESEHSLGLTTETAALLTFWLGYLTQTHEVLAVGTAIVLVAVLAHKQTLHGFVKGQLSETEFYDTLKFLLVVFVVYPLLPEGYLTQYELIKPKQLWLLVIVLSTISWSGYVLVRLLGGKRGLQVNALMGGLVSTTAITASLSQRAARAPEMARLFGVTAVMANSVQAPRLLVLMWVVDPELAMFMVVPLLTMFGVGLVGSLLLGHLKKVWKDEPDLEVLLDNPYRFWPAVKFALLIMGVLVASKLAQQALGDTMIYGVSAVAGLADVSAIAISMADMSAERIISLEVGAIAVVIALAANAIMKVGIALASGSKAVAFWLAGGLATMVAAAALSLWLMHPQIMQ
jgi:uncharacterized membrane protein (DUF4010 family)